MIKFEDGHIPEQNLKTLTAYISTVELINQGKRFLHEVLAELVKQSVMIHRIEIENIVTECIMSPETRKYIETKIRETIDEAIKQEVEEIFKRSIK